MQVVLRRCECRPNPVGFVPRRCAAARYRSAPDHHLATKPLSRRYLRRFVPACRCSGLARRGLRRPGSEEVLGRWFRRGRKRPCGICRSLIEGSFRSRPGDLHTSSSKLDWTYSKRRRDCRASDRCPAENARHRVRRSSWRQFRPRGRALDTSAPGDGSPYSRC